MSFLYPHLLWLILPLVFLVWKMPWKTVLHTHLFIMMLLLIALARPVEEHALQASSVETKDIIIALDVSFSMQASDLVPTRYTFAKQTINALLSLSPTDNVMLIAFTTNPLLLSPPTTDHTLISHALESLNPAYILTKGTSLKRLFKKVASLHNGHKHLILITDGGEKTEIKALSELINHSNVSLAILALGTTKGTTIKLEDGSMLKDDEGNLIVSRINPQLSSLATLTGGTYLESSRSPNHTASLLANTLKAAHNNLQRAEKMQQYYLELYQAPLILALLLFLMIHTRGAKYLLVLFVFFGVAPQAAILDVYYLNNAYISYAKKDYTSTRIFLRSIEQSSLQSKLLLGNTYYKERDFKKAIKIYHDIRSTSPSVKQHIYYNIANSYAMQGLYTKAKMYYAKVLQLGKDKNSTFNLSLIALLEDKKEPSLGIAHPKSQNAGTSKSQGKESNKEQKRSEDEPSSGSGGGNKEGWSQKKQKRGQIKASTREEHPLGSKVYDLINKGYIRETRPW